MNGLEKITARIEADAAAEAFQIEEEAKRRSETILAEGETKAQESYWRRVREGVKTTEDRAERLAKAADMEARKSVLSTKQTLVAETFDRAEQKLLSLSGEEYVAFLAAMAARASVTGREEIILSAADASALGGKVCDRANGLLKEQGRRAELTLSGDAGDFTGGLILRSGDVSVNCTVAALMAQARQEQASAVAAELFG